MDHIVKRIEKFEEINVTREGIKSRVRIEKCI